MVHPISGNGLNHDVKTEMLPIAITIQVLTTLVLFLRIAFRFVTPKNTFGLDDALIFSGWLLGLGLTISVCLGTINFYKSEIMLTYSRY
jgi:hypothetical protein